MNDTLLTEIINKKKFVCESRTQKIEIKSPNFTVVGSTYMQITYTAFFLIMVEENFFSNFVLFFLLFAEHSLDCYVFVVLGKFDESINRP